MLLNFPKSRILLYAKLAFPPIVSIFPREVAGQFEKLALPPILLNSPKSLILLFEKTASSPIVSIFPREVAGQF